jgi:hypothetical protein
MQMPPHRSTERILLPPLSTPHSLLVFAPGHPPRLPSMNASQGARLTVQACAVREWVRRGRIFFALRAGDPAFTGPRGRPPKLNSLQWEEC